MTSPAIRIRPRSRTPRRAPSLAAIAALVALVVGAAARAADPDLVSELSATIDGREVVLPSLKLDVAVKLQGDLASVTLTQVFANPYTEPLHARYVFPLPENAAVHAMRLVSGDRMIEAEIRPKPEARAVFEQAKQRGNQAALLDQHRPNVFTQEVANLTPGAPVRVELEYAHVVAKSHGTYRFHVPLVVGPRFLPPVLAGGSAGAPTREPGEPEPLAVGVWNLPATPPVAPPERVDRERVGLRVELDAGMPVRWLGSPTHLVSVERTSDSERSVTLAGGRTLDNRDFELHYRLAGESVAAGVTSYGKDGEGFVSLLLEPPTEAEDAALTPREMVFVLDCSGSMYGTPLEASKRFMRRSLAGLRPTDSFRIIRFSDAATEWTEQPLVASPEAIRKGIHYVNGLRGGGGTHMASGIRTALAPPVPEGALRLVVFLTDGYIGNDIEIVRLLEAERGEARLFSFGVGSSVNRYLIQEMARVGRGAARMVRPDEDAETAADELVKRLASPILTDIEIDWGDAAVTGAFPTGIPDLFLGQTLRVMARYGEPGRHRLAVRGKLAGRPVSLPLDVDLPADSPGLAGAALPILWARSQIEDRMVAYLAPGLDAHERDAIEQEVTALGLRHRLMTQWTSFVAVAKAVVNPGGEGLAADVAVPRVHGVPDSAYPPSALPAAGPATPAPQGVTVAQNGLAPVGSLQGLGAPGFQGLAGPEPSTWVALLAIAAAGLWWWRRGEAH